LELCIRNLRGSSPVFLLSLELRNVKKMGMLETDEWYESWKKTIYGNLSTLEKQGRGFHIIPAEDEGE